MMIAEVARSFYKRIPKSRESRPKAIKAIVGFLMLIWTISSDRLDHQFCDTGCESDSISLSVSDRQSR